MTFTDEEIEKGLKLLEKIFDELNIPNKPSPDGITRIDGMTVEEYFKKNPLFVEDKKKGRNNMKFYVLTLTKEIPRYDYDLEDWISDYEDICVGVFDNRDKAKDVAKRHYKNCDIFDISFFRITECELNEITDISQEYIS